MTTEQRLRSARRDVHVATRQAYAALISSNETILGDLPLRSANDGGGEEEDTRAGMDAGLALFGTSQGYRDQLEEEFHQKLRGVEEELGDIKMGLNSLDVTGGSADGNGNIVTPRSEYDSGPEGVDSGGSDLYSSVNDASLLQSHIQFLQRCSKARKLLEDVDALSLQTNFAPSTISGAKSPTNGNGSVAFPYSPSSICSPTELGRFAFDSPSLSSGEGDGASPMVKAAKLVAESEGVLGEVMESLARERGDKENSNNNHGSGEGDEGEEKIAQMQTRMLNELRHQTLRKKMELRHRATTLAEGCVVVNAGAGAANGQNELLVRGSGTSLEGAPSGKQVAFDMGESPISASTPRESVGGEIPPSPLSDAYEVLRLFSSEETSSYGESLDGAIKKLSIKLLDVLKPCLKELEEEKRQPDKSRGGRSVGYCKFTKEALRSGGATDRKYDPVTIKGPAVRLRWSMEHTIMNDNEEGGEDGESGCIATADEIDESALRSSPTADAATYLSVLNFVAGFLDFVYQHVLLRRNDLAAMLGKHLFGTYPTTTSIEAGSAVLSGVLVGAAAHGVEEGDEMPLMTMLVESMRRHCVPKDGSPGVWGVLKRVQTRMIEEVIAFECKMEEMGLMKVAAAGQGGARAVPTSPTPASSSSPTGLSVLMSNEGIGSSPINPNATLSNLSTLDTSFPQTSSQPDAKTDSNAAKGILSPLSELAHSLHQAYVEDRRSRILNRGRSILSNTDYHNTVTVGTYCPERAEAGSLASLDDDPLKVFALQQCSISNTAKQIMELVRSTLDDATDPAMFSLGNNDGGVGDLDALPPMLYRASREVLDLFRAIVPTMHAAEVGSLPRTAAVLHNDCVYLAHEAMLLGAEYKGRFLSLVPDETSEKGQKSKTQLLGEVCSFKDMVPPFRDLATKSMGSMIELQKGQLYELVSPRLANFQTSLASNESVTEWDDADTALRAALYHLRHLSQSWKSVLSSEVYYLSMGNLADLIFILLLDPVLKAEDITESASRFVHSLLLDAARGVAELFVAPPDRNAGGVGAAPTDGSADAVQRQSFQVAKKYAAKFDKSQAVGQFMCMRLDEIQRGLEEGVFRSVTARELSHLIVAAFDDSNKRMTLLNSLALTLPK